MVASVFSQSSWSELRKRLNRFGRDILYALSPWLRIRTQGLTIVVALTPKSQLSATRVNALKAFTCEESNEIIFVASASESVPSGFKGGRCRRFVIGKGRLPELLNVGGRRSVRTHILFMEGASPVWAPEQLEAVVSRLNVPWIGALAAFSSIERATISAHGFEDRRLPIWFVMSRKQFTEHGGFPTEYEEHFFDLDLCLKLKNAGKATLACAPMVASSQFVQGAGPQEVNLGDRAIFLDRWPPPR